MSGFGALLDRLLVATGQLSRADRRRWAATSSLRDLTEVTADWLQGRVDLQPGYDRAVDVDERLAPGLTAALIALNRAGFLTRSSQAGYDGPSGPDGSHLLQLAAVTGFADRATVGWLTDTVATTGHAILVQVCEGRKFGSPGVTVTSVTGQPVTAFGNQLGTTIITGMYRGCGAGAVAAVIDALQVTVYDPRPGVNDLWPLLHDAAIRRRDAAQAFPD